jgi:hypothetical protein
MFRAGRALAAVPVPVVRNDDAGRVRGGDAGIQGTTRATAPPTTWAAMNAGTDEGAMPANVLENIRPTVIAGLAKLADEVKKYAAPI